MDVGRPLVDIGFECGIDVSDGLLSDISRICESSGVGAEIEAHRVPVPDELKREYPDDWLDLALGGGEDYELIVVAPERRVSAIGRIRSVQTPRNRQDFGPAAGITARSQGKRS